MRIDMVNLADLVLDPRNAREHDRRNIDEIKRSLQAFGQHAPLVVQRSTNRVLIGNGRQHTDRGRAAETAALHDRAGPALLRRNNRQMGAIHGTSSKAGEITCL